MGLKEIEAACGKGDLKLKPSKIVNPRKTIMQRRTTIFPKRRTTSIWRTRSVSLGDDDTMDAEDDDFIEEDEYDYYAEDYFVEEQVETEYEEESQDNVASKRTTRSTVASRLGTLKPSLLKTSGAPRQSQGQTVRIETDDSVREKAQEHRIQLVKIRPDTRPKNQS